MKPRTLFIVTILGILLGSGVAWAQVGVGERIVLEAALRQAQAKAAQCEGKKMPSSPPVGVLGTVTCKPR